MVGAAVLDSEIVPGTINYDGLQETDVWNTGYDSSMVYLLGRGGIPRTQFIPQRQQKYQEQQQPPAATDDNDHETKCSGYGIYAGTIPTRVVRPIAKVSSRNLHACSWGRVHIHSHRSTMNGSAPAPRPALQKHTSPVSIYALNDLLQVSLCSYFMNCGAPRPAVRT